MYLSDREINIDTCVYTYGSNKTPAIKILAYRYHFTPGLIGEVDDSRAKVGRESIK